MFSAIEGAIFCDLNELERALDQAFTSEPIRLKATVSLEPILKGVMDVV